MNHTLSTADALISMERRNVINHAPTPFGLFFKCGAERDESRPYETMPFPTSSWFSTPPSMIIR